jgi:hypothetical protein
MFSCRYGSGICVCMRICKSESLQQLFLLQTENCSPYFLAVKVYCCLGLNSIGLCGEEDCEVFL